MLRRLLLACAAFMASPLIAGDVYIKTGRLIDVTTGTVLTGQCITVSGERITAVAKCGKVPKGTTKLDW